MDVVERLMSFIENETRSCSMDFGAISPEYVFRMWGGNGKSPIQRKVS